MSTSRRRSPNQSIRVLGYAVHWVADGENLALVGRALGISESSLRRWRARDLGMNVDDAENLKKIKAANATPKRLLTLWQVEKVALKKFTSGNDKPAIQAAAVNRLITILGYTERKGCRIVELARHTYRRSLAA